MVFEHFEHGADIGIKGIGKTVEEAFIEGAKALFDVMLNIEDVSSVEIVEVEVKARDIEGLFVEWLNELIYQKDITGKYFSKFVIDYIKEKNGYIYLKATALGENLDLNKHKTKVEVKGATYSQLSVKKNINEQWEARCIVDV